VAVWAQVAMMITMTHRRSGWSIANNGEMTVSTPFDGYRMSKWTWTHENSAGTWKCHHVFDIASRQFVVDINANHSVTRSTRQLSANVEFQTPPGVANWLQNMNAGVEYQHDLRAWKSNSRTNFRWGRYTVGHEHDFNIEPNSALVTTAKLTTPFRGYEQLGIGFNNRRSGNSWRANNEVLLGGIGKVTLDGSLNYNGYNFDGMVRMTSPIRHLERIVVNARNARQRDGVWASHADVQFAPDRAMSVDSKLSIGSRRSIELEVETPFRVMRQMKFKSDCSGTWRNLRASTELEHNMFGREKFTAVVSIDANNVQRMNGQLTVRTPFDEFSSLRVIGRHVRDSYEHATSTLSWQANHYRGSLRHEGTATGWADFDSRYELEYLNNRKIELSSSFHLDPKIVATATLRTPFEQARHVSFSFNQEGPLDNFKVVSELMYADAKKITTNMEFALRDDSLRTFFRLTTPFTAVSRLAFEVNLSGRPKQFNMQSWLEFNNHRLTKTLEFQLHQTTLRIRGNIETPFRQLRALTYAVNHDGDYREYRSNLVVTYNGQEITGSIEFYGSENNVNGSYMKYELRTPWRALRSLTYQQRSEPGLPLSGYSKSWTMESNGRQMSGSEELSWNGNQLDYRLVYNLPEEYSLRISHRGNSFNQFSNRIVVKIVDDQITGAMQFRRTSDVIDWKLNAASTFRGYERLEAAFKQEHTRSGFTTTASLSTPFRVFPRMSAELTFNGEPRQFTAAATVQLPFDGYERVSAELSHRGDWRSFQTSGKLETNQASLRRVIFSVDHTATRWTQIRTLASVVVPSGNYSAKFIHNGDVSNFRTNMEVRTPLTDYSRFVVDIDHEHVDGVKDAISVQTPIRGYENFGLSLQMSGDVGNMQLEAELRTPIRRLERSSVSWRHNINQRGTVELHGTVQTSVPQYQRAAMTFRHSMTRRVVSANVDVETSIPGFTKFSASSAYSPSRNGWQWSGSVETPIRGFERWSASAEHAQDDSDGGFNTVVRLTTPVNNYNNFAATLSHSGQASQFATRLRLSTPFRQVPQLDVTLRHRGTSPANFASSLTVDYAGKKIELETGFQMARVQHAELNYEGNFRLISPCPYVRDFSITVSHNRKPESTTGALKVVHNGNDKIDIDAHILIY